MVGLVLGFLFIFFPIPPAFAGIKINLVVVNAADENKDYTVKYTLPKELKFEDILDPAGFNVDYDTDQQAYYVGGAINLAPKESRIIKVEVKDVWSVSKEEVQSLKNQMDENLARLEHTPAYETGKALKEALLKGLDNIVAQQENFSGNTERRIEAYRSHADELKKIRDKISSVEYWEGKTAQIDLSLDSYTQGKTITMFIEIENPADNEAKSIKHRHFLPPEVRPEDILDTQGFEVRYDAQNKQPYLIKEEDFQPGEKKRYEIEIRDVWNIPEQTQKSLLEQAREASDEIAQYSYGKEYSNNIQVLIQDIENNVAEIEKSQKENKTVKQHIGDYYFNQKRLEQSREGIRKLNDILALMREKRLDELEKNQVRNVLQKLQSFKGIEAVSKAVFGQKPNVENTWRFIWMTIVFVAIFTSVHFLIWWRRSKGAKAGTVKEIEEAKEAEIKIK